MSSSTEDSWNLTLLLHAISYNMLLWLKHVQETQLCPDTGGRTGNGTAVFMGSPPWYYIKNHTGFWRLWCGIWNHTTTNISSRLNENLLLLSHTLNRSFIYATFCNNIHWLFGNTGSPSYTGLSNDDSIQNYIDIHHHQPHQKSFQFKLSMSQCQNFLKFSHPPNANFYLKVWSDLSNKCCQLFSLEWQAQFDNWENVSQH